MIEPYEGDVCELFEFVKLSAYLDSESAARRLLEIERTKGTRYFIARSGQDTIAAVGIYVDPNPEVRLLEPPQIIDIAVLDSYRRKGIRALLATAEQYVAASGEESVWVSTDGNAPALVSFYLSCGYLLAATIPGYWGPGSAKALFRKDLD